MSDLDKISSLFNAKIDSVKSMEDLQNVKTEFFGKNGQITSQFKNLGIARELTDSVDNWSYDKLDEVNRIAPMIKKKMRKNGII